MSRKHFTKVLLVFLDLRVLFNEILQDYPRMKTDLEQTSTIVSSPGFESAIVKIMSGDEASLSLSEQRPAALFVKSGKEECSQDNAPAQPMSIAERARKKRRFNGGTQSDYISLHWIPGTTNLVERFFSREKRCFSDYRKNLTPRNLEAQLFLCMNRDLWDATIVNLLVNPPQ